MSTFSGVVQFLSYLGFNIFKNIYKLYVELKKAMLIAIDNYTNWKNESEKIFSEKFDDKVWKENFKSLLKCVE